VGPNELHPPLSDAQLDAVVRQVYGTVANGGFGPGYGLIGLAAGHLSDLKRDVLREYQMFRQADPSEPGRSWPEQTLPICHWGCAIYSCVDCTTTDGAIARFDANPVAEDCSVAWGPENVDLIQWLQAWLDGTELFIAGTPPAAQHND
jgi:hypothetical protein